AVVALQAPEALPEDPGIVELGHGSTSSRISAVGQGHSSAAAAAHSSSVADLHSPASSYSFDPGQSPGPTHTNAPSQHQAPSPGGSPSELRRCASPTFAVSYSMSAPTHVTSIV